MARQKLYVSKLRKLNLNGKTITNADMSKYCTFRCGGKAKLLLEINTLETFLKVICFIQERNINYFILGKGSNLLVSDNGYNGIVLKLSGDLSRIEYDGDTIECGAGVTISQLFKFAYDNGLSGLEEGAGIPASIGGAVYMNASAYGYETGKLVEYVVAFVDGKISYFNNQECQFGYRSSVFQNNKGIILRVGLRFRSLDKEEIYRTFLETNRKRLSSQPLEYPSAGSVFKRIDGLNVSKMIDKLNLKGFTIGNAQISHKHTNFIINLGGAKAQDIYKIIEFVKLKFKEEYDFVLKTEIKFLGDFE